MPRKFLCLALTALAIPLALLGCGGGGGGSSVQQPTATPSGTPTVPPTATARPTATPTVPPLTAPTPLVEGYRMGADYFPAPNSNGVTVDGIACAASHFDYHIHSHLSIFLNGRMLAVPAAIGIKNPHFETSAKYPDGFVTYGDCDYSLHTHDTSGRLHIEAPEKKTFTLGEVFHIWGQPITRTNIAGITGFPLVIYINDGTNRRRYDGDPAAIELAPEREITFQLGSPISQIPTYNWDDEQGVEHNEMAAVAAHVRSLKR